MKTGQFQLELYSDKKTKDHVHSPSKGQIQFSFGVNYLRVELDPLVLNRFITIELFFNNLNVPLRKL